VPPLLQRTLAMPCSSILVRKSFLKMKFKNTRRVLLSSFGTCCRCSFLPTLPASSLYSTELIERVLNFLCRYCRWAASPDGGRSSRCRRPGPPGSGRGRRWYTSSVLSSHYPKLSQHRT